jgi:hypothetical protein
VNYVPAQSINNPTQRPDLGSHSNIESILIEKGTLLRFDIAGSTDVAAESAQNGHADVKPYNHPLLGIQHPPVAIPALVALSNTQLVTFADLSRREEIGGHDVSSAPTKLTLVVAKIISLIDPNALIIASGDALDIVLQKGSKINQSIVHTVLCAVAGQMHLDDKLKVRYGKTRITKRNNIVAYFNDGDLITFSGTSVVKAEERERNADQKQIKQIRDSGANLAKIGKLISRNSKDNNQITHNTVSGKQNRELAEALGTQRISTEILTLHEEAEFIPHICQAYGVVEVDQFSKNSLVDLIKLFRQRKYNLKFGPIKIGKDGKAKFYIIPFKEQYSATRHFDDIAQIYKELEEKSIKLKIAIAAKPINIIRNGNGEKIRMDTGGHETNFLARIAYGQNKGGVFFDEEYLALIAKEGFNLEGVKCLGTQKLKGIKGEVNVLQAKEAETQPKKILQELTEDDFSLEGFIDGKLGPNLKPYKDHIINFIRIYSKTTDQTNTLLLAIDDLLQTGNIDLVFHAIAVTALNNNFIEGHLPTEEGFLTGDKKDILEIASCAIFGRYHFMREITLEVISMLNPDYFRKAFESLISAGILQSIQDSSGRIMPNPSVVHAIYERINPERKKVIHWHITAFLKKEIEIMRLTEITIENFPIFRTYALHLLNSGIDQLTKIENVNLFMSMIEFMFEQGLHGDLITFGDKIHTALAKIKPYLKEKVAALQESIARLEAIGANANSAAIRLEEVNKFLGAFDENRVQKLNARLIFEHFRMGNTAKAKLLADRYISNREVVLINSLFNSEQPNIDEFFLGFTPENQMYFYILDSIIEIHSFNISLINKIKKRLSSNHDANSKLLISKIDTIRNRRVARTNILDQAECLESENGNYMDFLRNTLSILHSYQPIEEAKFIEIYIALINSGNTNLAVKLRIKFDKQNKNKGQKKKKAA